MNFRFISVFLIFLSPLLFQGNLNAQNKKAELVEISGILLSADSLHIVADARILSKDNYVGSFSDTLGRFNIVANSGDSLMFSSLGYQTRVVPVTDSLLSLTQPIIFRMALDTVLIHEIVIHAFWDYETFKFMVTHMKPAPYYDLKKELDQNPLLYKEPNQAFTVGGPIQALYNWLNKKAVLRRKLIRNRRAYNQKMIDLGRPQDTIPSKPEYMREKQH